MSFIKFQRSRKSILFLKKIVKPITVTNLMGRGFYVECTCANNRYLKKHLLSKQNVNYVPIMNFSNVHMQFGIRKNAYGTWNVVKSCIALCGTLYRIVCIMPGVYSKGIAVRNSRYGRGKSGLTSLSPFYHV